MAQHTIHFGVLLWPDYQWLDAAGSVDYLNNHSQTYLKGITGLDEATLAKAPIIKWYYISHDLKLVHSTSGPAGVPTYTYADCPELDYLLVPGPNDSREPLPEGCSAFLHKIMAHHKFKALLTVCTGSLALAQTDILDGLSMCSNKVELKAYALAGILNKKVRWIGDRRWHVDGRVWSSAGITAGIDLVAEFARVHFDPAIVQLAKDASEYTPNPAFPDPFAHLLDGIDLS